MEPDTWKNVEMFCYSCENKRLVFREYKKVIDR